MHETQFLQPRQLTQLSLPSLSGIVVVPVWLLDKQRTRLEGRGAGDQKCMTEYFPHDISQAGGFCTCDVINVSFYFGSCETDSGEAGPVCGQWIWQWMWQAESASLRIRTTSSTTRPSALDLAYGRRDDSRWPCQQRMREWRMSGVIG